MISVSRAGSYLSVSGEEDYLAQLLAAAAADVSALLGWQLAAGEREEILDVALPTLGATGYAPEPLLNSVRLAQPVAGPLTALAVSERPRRGAPWSALSNTVDGQPVWELSGDRLFRRIGQFPPGDGLVKVRYPAGWAPGALPPALEGAILDLVADRYRPVAARRAGGGLDAASVRGVSLQFRAPTGSAIPAAIEQRLLRLRPAGAF